MTPKIFATEVKKPVNRLCRREGEKRKERKKKGRKKEKKKRSECAFPRFHTALPFILLLSPSFYHPLRHRSLPLLSTSLPAFLSPLPSFLLPSTAYFSTIFPRWLDRYRSSLERRCRSYLASFLASAVFTSFLETSVAHPSSLPPSLLARIACVQNVERCRYDSIFERLVNSIHGN